MKYFKCLLMSISVFLASNLYAESTISGLAKPREDLSTSGNAPYAGVSGGISQIALNGQIKQLMPNFCVFYQPGQQNPVCQYYWEKTVHNIIYASPKIAYCENLEYELNSLSDNNYQCGGMSQAACYDSMRTQIQVNLSNFCGD